MTTLRSGLLSSHPATQRPRSASLDRGRPIDGPAGKLQDMWAVEGRKRKHEALTPSLELKTPTAPPRVLRTDKPTLTTLAELWAWNYSVGPMEAFGNFPDFVILAPTNGGIWRAFHVSREIVSGASQMLGKMLQIDLREKSRSAVCMPDSGMDAEIINKALGHLYGKTYDPQAKDVVQMASLLDYWMPAKEGDNRWEQLLRQCKGFIRDNMTAANLPALWHGASEVHDEVTKLALIRFAASDDKAHKTVTELESDELAEFINNPRFNPEEDKVVDIIFAWGEKNFPHGADVHEFYAELMRSVRWERVSESQVVRCLDAGLLSDEEAGKIWRMRYSGQRDAKPYKLPFGEAIAPRIGSVTVSEKSNGAGFVAEVTVPNLKASLNSSKSSIHVPFTAAGRHWRFEFPTPRKGFYLSPLRAADSASTYPFHASYNLSLNGEHSAKVGKQIWKADESGWGSNIPALANGTCFTEAGELPIKVDFSFEKA